MLSSLYRRNKT